MRQFGNHPNIIKNPGKLDRISWQEPHINDTEEKNNKFEIKACHLEVIKIDYHARAATLSKKSKSDVISYNDHLCTHV